MTTRVFVYGTLMRGGRYHGLLGDAHFVGEACTVVGFRLYDLGPYPAMVRGGEISVVGELYDVDAATLADLDRLEGHPDYYRRAIVGLADGQEVTSYLFVSASELVGTTVVQSGDWRRK